VFSLGIGIDNYIFLHSNPTSHITKVLYGNGIKGYEFPTVKIFMKLVKKSSRFYDIGAHFGYYSMLSNAINDKISIVAFEPMPGAFHYLKKNFSLNNIKNIRLEQLALRDHSANVKIQQSINPKFKNIRYQLSSYSGIRTNDDRTFIEEVSVQAITLDHIKEKTKPAQ
jgi:FkbM family methyltransferase